MPPKNHKRGTPTARQTEIVEFYRSLPVDCARQTLTANHFGISSSNVLKHVRAFKRNTYLQMGYQVPDLKDLMKQGACSNDNEGGGLVNISILRLVAQDGVALDQAQPQSDAYPTSFLEPGDGGAFEERPAPIDPFIRDRKAFERRMIDRPAKGILRLLFTSAQDGTAVHRQFFANLERYLDWCKVNSGGAGAELIVSGFTYNKKAFGAAHEKKQHVFLSSDDLHDLDEKDLRKLVFFDNRIEPHYSQDHIELDGLLDLCAEINTLPTAVAPLSGFHSYTQGRWGIFPHVKHHLESIARMPGKPYKANITTGACTVPNYVAKKAGQKAEMHHTIGCVIVECLPDGRFWVRTISADPETGAFRDLDRLVDEDGVHEGQSVATISYGDVHHEKVDHEVAKATWGYCPVQGKTVPAWRRKSLLDRLRPEHQFFHDVSDFAPRNHHNRKSRHFRWNNYFRGVESVEFELERIARFLKTTRRPGCNSVVVQSNHDNAFLKWLDESTPLEEDAINAGIFLKANLAIWENAQRGAHDKKFCVFRHTLRDLAPPRSLDDVIFVNEQSSYVVHGVEHSQHGHIGPNGSRGSPKSLSKVAPKMTTGHTHSPWIGDGQFVSGVCQLDMDYNVGSSSWALAHTIGHHDGTRQILFFDGGDFHA